MGAYNLNHSESSRQTILVKSIIHPDFNHNNLTADLAILKLTKPAKINQFVNVLCLSEKTFAPETKCYAAGWGETMDIQSDPERSSLLREIVAPLWSWSNCKTLLDGINNGIQFDQTMTCAGGVNGAPHLCSVRLRFLAINLDWSCQTRIYRGIVALL